MYKPIITGKRKSDNKRTRKRAFNFYLFWISPNTTVGRFCEKQRKKERKKWKKERLIKIEFLNKRGNCERWKAKERKKEKIKKERKKERLMKL